jgi:hypothetical protein
VKRFHAEIEGGFVVLLIGMRINKPWLVHRWLPVALAMRRMLRELAANPQIGLLRYETALIHGLAVVQYWRSPEALDRFAHDQGDLHIPAWRDWNRRIRDSEAVGIWHETYQVRAHESVYVNTPVFGLAAAGQST